MGGCLQCWVALKQGAAYKGVMVLLCAMKSLTLAVPWALGFAALVCGPAAQSQAVAPAKANAATSPEVDVRTLQRPAGAVSDPHAVVVQSLRVTGVRSLDAADVVRASGFVVGAAYSVLDLRALAARMREHYQQQGYFLAQVYVPAQDITDGVLRLEVVEGQYGQVSVRNRSRLADSVAARVMGDLRTGSTVNSAALERRLMLLSDMPAVQVQSTLTPGAATGTSDLLVDLSPTAQWVGSLEADNHGNAFTGANRLGASLHLNELLGYADQFQLRALSSGEGLAYARASYQALLGETTVGLAYTHMQYQLGGAFASTNSSGTARVGGLFASYPLIRSKAKNLSVQGALESKALTDQVDVGGLGQATDKQAQTQIATLRGDFQDRSGTGQTTYQLQWTHGEIRLNSADAADADSRSANSAGTFDKLAYALTYQKAVGADSVIYAGLHGQWASKNLDASEKFSLGGPNGVRAYPGGEATGDEGAILSLEWRTGLPSLTEALSGQVQWMFFLDAGSVTLNKTPWDNLGSSNTRALRAAGLGLSYQGSGNWGLKAIYAMKLGTEAATSSNDAQGRFWLQASKNF